MGNYIEIGKRIQKKRKEQQLTQEELAHRCGYSTKTSISRIENGEINIPHSKIVEMANALNVSPNYLLNGEDSTEPTLEEIEEALLEIFRKIPLESKPLALEMLRTALKAAGILEE